MYAFFAVLVTKAAESGCTVYVGKTMVWRGCSESETRLYSSTLANSQLRFTAQLIQCLSKNQQNSNKIPEGWELSECAALNFGTAPSWYWQGLLRASSWWKRLLPSAVLSAFFSDVIVHSRNAFSVPQQATATQKIKMKTKQNAREAQKLQCTTLFWLLCNEKYIMQNRMK